MGESETPKKKTVEDFEYGECLGEGSYGSVCMNKIPTIIGSNLKCKGICVRGESNR